MERVTHEHRPSLGIEVHNLVDYGLELFFFRPEDHIGIIRPDENPVCRYDHDIEVVDLPELHGLRIGGAGHACELLVHAKIVLEGDRGEGLVLPFDLYVLFRLEGLVGDRR